MINSILDIDLYKLTTSYAYMKKFPHAIGTFKFIDRNSEVYTSEFLTQLKLEIWKLPSLKMSVKEFNWAVTNIPFIPKWYWEWLQGFSYNPEELDVSLDELGHLQITATGNIHRISLWETTILAIVSELSYKQLNIIPNMYDVLDKLTDKISLSNTNQLLFSEFGTRRRFASQIQDMVCEQLAARAQYCTGTSNCYFAMKYHMKPIGTHPHEWFMFHGAQFGYKHANYLALENWQEVYDGNLGIALTDTYTTEVFLRNFSMKHAKLFDGVRQDSGDPFMFVNKVIERYKEHKIDPTIKTIIFSDGLDFPKALEIQNYCKGRIRVAFGIGTNLTNDCGFIAKNIVMKLVSCKMNPSALEYNCVKLSDSPGKHLGKDVELCKLELNLK